MAADLRSALESCINRKDTFVLQQLTDKTDLAVNVFAPVIEKKGMLKDTMGAGTVLDWPSLEIARQITLFGFDLFENIQPKECLSQAWNKPNRYQIAPNISSMMDRTNKMVLWTSQQILQHANVARRAKAVCKLIKVAVQLKRICNFNGLKEIVGGLRSIPIARLLKTWELVDQKLFLEFQDLEEFLHQRKNFKNMRDAMKTEEGSMLPYIGLFLTDLTFCEDGNRDEIDGLINYYKKRKYAVVIKEMLRLQGKTYKYLPVKELQGLLNNIPELTEDE